jgi:serine protease
VIVAVTDTGLATGGPDGVGCASPDGYDVVNQDDDPDDGDGHGTHVSGTIAQATNNHVGVSGMAHGACVLPIKVLDDSGSGTTADVAEGIFYAVEKGAKVINMSLGISADAYVTSDPMMDPALDYAHDHGVTVVCAAGNEAVSTNVGYPAIYPTTIAVGATDAVNELAPYSNFGDGLDIVAPGGDISADLDNDGSPDGVLQETRIRGEWGYWFFRGTSMASPHVAAVAAMLIAREVATTPAEVYEAMTSTALDLGQPGYDPVYGYGLVQAHDALNGAIIEPPVCTDDDGDGVCLEDGDCNDEDATIYPGAFDSKSRRDNNNVDNDCDGRIDR